MELRAKIVRAAVAVLQRKCPVSFQPFQPASHMQTWGYGSYDADLGLESMRGAYGAALSHGCNLFDTAESYGGGLMGGWGASERFLADCMRQRPPDMDPQTAGPNPVVVSKYIPLPWRIFEPRSMLGALRASGGLP